jgi:opacity protein-like surface antigen
MKEQKNLDRLFQEKFKDFEATPPPFVWSQIEKRLPSQVHKKRGVPFFWKVASIAAALFFVVYFSFLHQKEISLTPENEVVNIENQKNIEKNDVFENKISNPTQKNESTKYDDEETYQNQMNPNELNKESLDKKADWVHGEKKTNVKNNGSNTLHPSKMSKGKNGDKIFDKKFIVQSSKKNGDKHIDYKTIENQTSNKDGNQVAKTDSLGLQNSLKSKDVVTNSETFKNKKHFNRQNIDSLFVSEIEVAAVEETNPLEELLKEKEQQQKTNPNSEIDRWQVASTVAPVYFNSLAGGSTIDAQFAENQKTTETQMSFGLGVQYAVTSRISVRTGINRLNLGYNTNGIEFMPTLNGQVLANVDPNNLGQTFMVQNTSGVTAFIENPIQTKDQGYLNQRLGYLEIPLEMKYRLIDKKFGLTFIGGMSSLLLTDNQINAVSSSFNTNLGEATNINTFSFSTNLGIGIEYRFFKSFQANFEPMLKYQLNTFSNNTSGFRPYFFGLYSGISYHF